MGLMNRRPVAVRSQGKGGSAAIDGSAIERAAPDSAGRERADLNRAVVDLVDLERAKRASVGQLLFKCARLFNEQAIARVNEEGTYPILRPAHTNLFPHIDFVGIRLVDLARKVGISKQAVSQTVAELTQLGVVETVTDGTDARAKLVRFTARGAAAIAHGLDVLVQLEKELEPRVGADTMAQLHEALSTLESVLTLEDSARTRPPGGQGKPTAKRVPKG